MLFDQDMSIKLEQSSPMKQGIVTILRSDCELGFNKSSSSIRRTLSADMSSKQWLSQNGFFSSIKKNVNSQILNPSQDDVWKSIQSHREKNDERLMQKPALWGDILDKDKKKDNCSLDDIYVHPLLKRSSRSLSEKSLEICTESLGSETGSDVYSSFGFSSDGDEDFKEMVMVERDCEFKEINRFEDLHVVKYKKSPVRPFPPPLSSIGGGGNAAAPSLHMHSRRENGRLVVEAVSVPQSSNFSAQRSNGRLVLTLINKENKVEELEKMFDIEEEEKVGGRAHDDVAAAEKFVVEQNLRSLSSGMVMKKLMAFGSKNSTWSNKTVNVMAAAAKAEAATELVAEEKNKITHSLPPRVERMIPLPPPTVSSFNPYEYFWRNKTTVSGGGFITTQQSTVHGGAKGSRNQDLVVMRGNKGDYFVGCKEQKRSLSFWEPYCIATS